MKGSALALIPLLAALHVCSLAQTWEVNASHALVWKGEPYLPVGVRIPGEPDRIRQAAQAGIRDAVVELPANGSGWKEAFDALETAGMHYILAITSLPPMAQGIAIEPQSYRVSDLFTSKDVHLSFPDALSVYGVLANKRDASVAWMKKFDVVNGQLDIHVTPPDDLGYTLLLYPEFTGRDLPDYWDAFDTYRDQLLISLRKTPPGKGLRGILNPMGGLSSLEASHSGFIPTSTLFRYELKAALEDKYHGLDTAVKLWNIAASDIETWDQLTRLVPLWSGTRGIPQLYDPTTGKTYLSDSRHSTIWTDLQQAIAKTERMRLTKLVEALRQASGVPVLQEWRGWSDLYEGPTNAVDGVGMRPSGNSFSGIAETGSPAISSVLRASKPCWSLASDIDVPTESYAVRLQDLAEMGSRGWFFRSSGPAQDKLVAALTPPPSSVTSDPPVALFYPESATNPAAPQLLPGGKWWLPSPAAGNRVELGSGYSCYRYDDGVQSYFEIWQDGPPVRTKIRLAEPKLAVVKSLTGQDLDVKVRKNGLELTMGSEPIMISGIDEIPVPEAAFNALITEADAILSVTEREMLSPGVERIDFQNNIKSFERTPGGAFTLLMAELRSLRMRFGPYIWQEGEVTRKATFSETATLSGCSGGAALAVHAVMPSTTYMAEYDIASRSPSDQEVWIAARIPKGQEKGWSVEIGGQVMHISSPATSGYGTGFAWYKLGITRLAAGATKLRVMVDALQGTEEALDAIVICPGEFRPNGTSMPPVLLRHVGPPPKRKGRG